MTDADTYRQQWIEAGAQALHEPDPDYDEAEQLEGCRTLAEMVLDAVVPLIRQAIAERLNPRTMGLMGDLLGREGDT